MQDDFGEAVRGAWAARWPRTATEAGRTTRGTIVSRGFYGQQLEHVLSLFEREQVLVLDYHRLFAELEATLNRVAAFINVPAFAELPVEQHERPAPQELVAEPPSASDISELAKLYAPDLEQFARISGIDVSAWPTTRVVTGTLQAAELAGTLADRAQLVRPSRNGRPTATPTATEPGAVPPTVVTGSDSKMLKRP